MSQSHAEQVRDLQRQIASVDDSIECQELTLRRLDLEQSEIERQAEEAKAELADLRKRAVGLQLAKARGDDVDQGELDSINRWATDAAETVARMPVALELIEQQRRDAQTALDRLTYDAMLTEYEELFERENELAATAVERAVAYQGTVSDYENLKREILAMRNQITAHLNNSPALQGQHTLSRGIRQPLELVPGGVQSGQFRHWYRMRNQGGGNEAQKPPL